MKLIGVVRLGHDAEMRYTKSGDAVVNFSAVYDVGYGDKKSAQWVKFSMFGKRGESVCEYLLKGSQVFITASDPKIKEFANKDGTINYSLEAKVDDLQLLGTRQEKKERDEYDAPASTFSSGRTAETVPPGRKIPAAQHDFEDDIPF